MSADQLTAYQLATRVYTEHGVPVFPVKLTQDPSGKWQKMPLCKWSQGEGHPSEFNWRQANALGVPMGRRSGLLTLDLDTYKDDSEAQTWVEKNQLPATRIHQTASGGQHLIFRLPAGYDLGNHAPKVEGLDVRGTGGFIVWADIDGRYDVVNDLAPAQLPRAVCEELLALKRGYSAPLSDSDLPDWHPVDEEALVKKLQAALADPFRRDLTTRFRGSTANLKDRSASAKDMSMASLLASRGFTYSEIFMVLMQHFPHGTAARDGWDEKTERAAMRCAARALHQLEERSDGRLHMLIKTLAGRLKDLHEAAQRAAVEEIGPDQGDKK